MKSVKLWVDGSARRGGGQKGLVPGGWAALLKYGEHERKITGGHRETTANQMEVMAILEGLEALTEPCRVEVITDSRNAIGWLSGEFQCNFEWNRQAKEVYDILVTNRGHSVTFEWIDRNAGVPENETVDELARRAVEYVISLEVEVAAEAAEIAYLYWEQPLATDWPPPAGSL